MSAWLFVVLSVIIILAGPASVLFTSVRASTTGSEYDSMPRRFGVIVLTLSTLGTIVGGGMFLAVGQMGFEAGLLGFVIGLVYLVGLTLFGFSAPMINKALDEAKVDFISDLIKHHFGNVGSIIFCGVNLLIFVPMIAAQFLAIFHLHEYVSSHGDIGIAIYIPMVLAILILFIYPIIGGIRMDIWSDFVQSMILIMVLIPIFYYMIAPTDWVTVLKAMPPSHLDGTGYGAFMLVGVIAFLTPTFFVRSDMWQRLRSARSDQTARWSFAVAGLLSLVFYSVFSLIGMLALQRGTGSASTATFDAFRALIDNPTVLTFIFATLFAATLSSADTFINNSGAHAKRLYAGLLPNGRDVSFPYFAFGSTAAALGLAFVVPDIVELFVASLSLLMIFLVPVLSILAGCPRSEKAFILSGLVSTILFLVLFVAWNPQSAFVPAVVASMLIYYVVGRWEKPKASDANLGEAAK